MVRRHRRLISLFVTALAVALTSTTLAQQAFQLASTRGMPSPCGSVRTTSIPWPFGHGKCDSRECWNDPNPVCSCQQDEWGMYWCNQKLYVEGLACRWEPFGTEDCTNTIINGDCYYTSYYNPSPLPGCVGNPYSTMVTKRDFCARP